MTTEAIVESRLCRKAVKDSTGKAAPCDTKLPKGQPECRNKANHVRPYKNGFCGNGMCEGKKVLGPGGKPLKTCADWRLCPCDCHKEFDKLYSMMEMPRLYQDMSGYEKPINTYRVPTLEERAALHAAARSGSSVEEVIIESPMPEAIPVTLKKSFNVTPTGRAARGQLESWVRAYCDEYLVEAYPHPCTPKFVAEAIGKEQGIQPPSQGAVNAVFERWASIGFAIIEKKPTRFTGYTKDGIALGLEAMKLREVDARKSKMANAARTLRPKK